MQKNSPIFALFTFHHKLNWGNCPVRVTTDTGRGSIQHQIYLDMDKPRLSHSHNTHTAQSTSCTHRWRDAFFILPFCRANNLDGNLSEGLSKRCLFCVLLTSCQVVPALANIWHSLLGLDDWTTISATEYINGCFFWVTFGRFFVLLI